MTPEERFRKKYRVGEKDCWNWNNYLDRDGYGQFWFNGSNVRAHRFLFELKNGKIKKGLVIDHLCRNRACVNPDHLEAVKNEINLKRGNIDHNKHKTECPRGHKYDEVNTYWYQERRQCNSCRRKRALAVYYSKNKTK